MSENIRTIESTTGRNAANRRLRDVFGTVYDFDVASPQTEFTGIAALVAADQRVDVLVNGKELREGATHDFQRDVGATKIVFNYSIPQSAWVRVRVYP